MAQQPSLDDLYSGSGGSSLDDLYNGAAAPAAPKAPASATAPKPSGMIRRTLGDTAVDVGRGVIGLGEAAVGLANIPTMGYAGKGLEAIGYRPEDTKDMIGELYSPERKAAQEKVADAEGFIGTAAAMIDNPSTIVGTVAESVPSILGGGAIAQGLRGVRGLGAVARAAIGEGAIGAGAQAEGIRQESDDGLLNARQTAAAIGTGIGTGVIGAGGGALARRLGVTDVDVALAGGGTADAAQAAAQNPVRRVLEGGARGAVAEGVFEEMPQSMQEQAWQNFAHERPLGEGVPESAAMGLLAGMAMGGPVGALSGTPADVARAVPPPPAPPVEDPAAVEAALRANIGTATSPEGRAVAQAELADYLEREGRLIGQDPVEVAPTGEARTGAQTRALADAELALQRDLSLTPDLRSAQPGHMGFTRTLPDGSPVPDPENGPLSRAANIGVANGAVDQAAADMALAAEMEAREAAEKAQGKTTVGARVRGQRTELEAEERAAQDPPPVFTPEQSEAYLMEQATRGPLPKAQIIARAFGMTPRAAYELRRKVVKASRAQAAPAPAPAQEGNANALPAGPEPQRPAVEGAVDARRNPGAAAGGESGAAGQPGALAGRGAAAPAAAPDPVPAPRAGQAEAGSLTEGAFSAAPKVSHETPTQGAVAVAEEVDPAEMAALKNRNRTPPAVEGDTWDTAAVLRDSPVGHVSTMEGPRTPERPDGAIRWTKLEGERWTDGKTTLDTNALARVFDRQDESIDGTATSPPLQLAASEAATSPDNDLPTPTEAQKEAGNYKKGHARIAGLDVSIENPAGSRRRPEWPPLKDHYGYVRGSVGADKDHIDVFMTDRAEDPSLPVFVVDQVNKDGSFDEHKVVMGTADEAEARATYLRNYEKGWTGLGGITQMTQDEFKAWVKDPSKTRRPAGHSPVTWRAEMEQALKSVPADHRMRRKWQANAKAGLPSASEREGLLAQVRAAAAAAPEQSDAARASAIEAAKERLFEARRKFRELGSTPSELSTPERKAQVKEAGQKVAAIEREIRALRAADDAAPVPSSRPVTATAPTTPPATATAPEHERAPRPGLSVPELERMAKSWREFIDGGGDAEVTRIFEAPKKSEVVRLADKAKVYHRDHGWMTVEQAKAQIDAWEARALEQGRDPAMVAANSQKIVLSLFDLTGSWSLPWEQAGYQVYRFDIQDEGTYEDPETGEERKIGDVHNMSTEFFNDLFGSFDGLDVHAVLAACPCTDFAVSGARHFAAKDADGRTVSSVQLVQKTLQVIEYFKPAVWAIENPVGRIERLGGLPPWRLSFDPNHLGDPYTKKTLLWGRFNADLPVAPVEPTEGSKMHRLYGGKSMATKNARSATPEGFAYGFFMANNAIDNPAMALANKYDRLDGELIGRALEAGITEQAITEAVDDLYYMELDDDGANAAIRELIEEGAPPPDAGRAPDTDVAAVAVADTPAAGGDVAAFRKAMDALADRAFAAGDGKMSGRIGSAALLWKQGEKDATQDRLDDVVADHRKRVEALERKRATMRRLSEANDLTGESSPESRASLQALLDDPAAKHVDGTVPLSAFPAWEAAGKGFSARQYVRNGSAVQEVRSPTGAIARRRMSPDGITSTDLEATDSLDNVLSGAAFGEFHEFFQRSPALAAPKASGQFASNTIFTADKVEAAKARLRAKLGTLNSGIDPELLVDGMTIAGGYIESGVRSFADYAKAMIRDLGEGVKPYLLSFYEAARHYPGLNREGMDSVDAAARAFDGLLAPADTAIPAVGQAKPPAKRRAKASDAAGERRLVDDYGTDYITGYPEPGDRREVGSATKDRFIKDTSSYLKGVAGILEEGGYTATVGARGKANKAVTVNEGGMAGSGDVHLHMVAPSGTGIYVTIGGTTLRGVVPSTTSGITLMYRTTDGTYSKSGPNQWGRVDLTAAELAAELAAHVERADQRPAQERATPAERAHNAPTEAPDVRREGDRQGDRAGSVRGDQRQQPAENRDDDAAARVDAEQRPEAARDGQRGDAAASPQEAAPRSPGRGERGAAAEQPSDAGGVPADRGPAPQAVAPKTDLTITGELDFAGVGAVGKFNQNLAAIRLLKELEAAGRRATPAEQSILARYVGWGGLPQAFRHPTSGKISKGWEGRVAELEEAMTADELAAAGRSTQDAHYTAANVVRAMWDAVARMGFTGGLVLEPSMGTGNFFGLMPTGLRGASKLTGVELDSITGRIAKQLYQNANVQVRGFNDLRIAPASFDLAIGNPPFGAQSIHDPQYPEESKASIHNYFFAKSIASVRPGGLLAMVVSSSFLDANTSATRTWISERARFIGAIRLPQTAFQANAGTNVTTDVVFLQRLPEGAASNPEAWVRVGSMTDKGNAFPINRYFLDHPDMMLGRMVWSTHTTVGRAGAVLEATEGVDLSQAMADALAKLPQDLYQQQGKTFEQAAEKADPEPMGELVPDSAKVYGYFMDKDGSLRQRQPDMNGEAQSVAVDLPATSVARVAGMARIRDLARALLRAELKESTTDADLAERRAELGKVYDAFVKAHGRLSRDVNKRLFADDPDGPLLLSLERDYDRGVSAAIAKKNGVSARPESAKKADIFSKRTNYPVKPVTEVKDARSAMLASLNERGRVDPEFMAGIYPGKSIEEIEAELGDAVFRAPDGELVPADAYLSGNVKAKLAAARASDAPGMDRNIAALERVQPADVDAADIFVQVGTPWIPASDYGQFVRETFEGEFTGSFVPALGRWAVSIHSRNRTLDNERWGHERLGASRIMELLLENKPIAIYDKGPDDSRILNVEDTAAAKGKAAELQQEFLDWIWKDAERRERLSRYYNDTYNTDVRRTYSGEHMTFPGMNRGILSGGALRPHQGAFAYRMVQDGTALADHVVGAGKTFASIAGTMEMRRLGLWRKPMITVPNHLVDQWATDFVRLYPGANVLAASRKDFEKGNRKRLFARIATGDWDAVIVAHSSFGFIPLPPDAERSILEGEVAEITTALDALREANGKKDLSFKQLQKRKEALDERIKRMAERPRDDLMDFAEMGVDALVVDEAHEFKNLYFVTTQRNVAGLGSPEGSKKAFDLFVKMRYLNTEKGGKNTVFLTGTPVSNTLSEVFHMQRYLQYDELVARNVAMFDTWAATFGQIVSDWEMDAAGRFKEKARFRKFANLPELVTMWRQVADTVTLADLRRDAAALGKRFPVPKIKGGKRQNITVPRSPLQAEYIGQPKPVMNADGTPAVDPETGIPLEQYEEGSIIHRMDNMPKDPSIDNHLKATGDARKASLDFRLVEPGAPDFEGSKINVAVKNIARIWKENAERRGTQLVFCDLSVPASARGKATEAAQAKAPTWFVTDGGDLEHVPGVRLSLSAMPDAQFFSYKTKRDGYRVHEANSGLYIASGRTKQDAVDDANATLTRNAASWREKFAAGAIPSEAIDAYVQRWEDQRAAQEEQASEGEGEGEAAQVISMDELLADQSKHSVYDDMKAKLIAAGVPEKEIAFIHDYNTDLQKADLFGKVNRGEIRVLFGSTAKMGAGMNVQKKLVAEHHMDAPWRPSDLTQREGRILRQGNEFYEADPDGFEVELVAYGTEQTYDARQWEIIETKAQGIETFQAGDSSVREIEDISSEAASAADMKGAASGNPLILESIKLRKEVRDLESQARSHTRAMHAMESLIRSVENKSAYEYKHLQKAQDADRRLSGVEFGLTLSGTTFTDPKEVKVGPIMEVFKAALSAREPVRGGTFRGLDVVASGQSTSIRVTLYDGKDAVGATEFAKDDKVSPSGFVTRLENIHKRIAAAVPDAEARVARLEREAEQARDEVSKGFPREAELEQKRARQVAVVTALRSGRRSVEGDEAPADERLHSRPIRSEASALSALKAGREDRPLPAARVRELVGALRANWPGAPRVVVLEQDPEGDAAGSEGWYDAAKGEVVLVAPNIRGGYDPVLKQRVSAQERVRMVAVHEIIGHAGIEAITGPELWAELEQTIDRMRASGNHSDLFQSIDRRYRGVNRAIATREAIAVMAEKGVRNSVLDRVIAALRRFLRDRLGLSMRFSEAELRQHIVAAARHVRGNARPRQVRRAGAFASRADLDPARPVQVARIRSGRFGSTATAEARKGARERAFDWLEGMRTRGETFRNNHSGIVIGFSREGNRELRTWTARPERIDMLAALPQITRHAVLVDMTTERDGAGGVSRWATLYAPVALDGRLRIARLVARDAGNGSFAYDLQHSTMLETASPASAGLGGGGGSGTKSGAPTTLTVAQVREAVNAAGLPGWAMSRTPGAFYSALAEAVAAGRGAPKRGAAAAWKGWLDGAQRRGEFKQSERDWLGVDAWLEGVQSATREELEAFIRANEVQVREVVLSQHGHSDLPANWQVQRDDDGGWEVVDQDGDVRGMGETRTAAIEDAQDPDERANEGGLAKYGSYQLPGGDNYRELLLTLPLRGGDPVDTMSRDELAQAYEAEIGYNPIDDDPSIDTEELREQVRDLRPAAAAAGTDVDQGISRGYRSSHWAQENVLAHVRYNERTDADGRRVLFIEEIQSDWHQEGRKKGYRGSANEAMTWTIRNADGDGIGSGSGRTAQEAIANWRRIAGERGSQAVDATRTGESWEGSAGVPDAPFKGTDEWAMLAFKRMVRHAAENGFDRIAWPPGEIHAQRYDLSTQVNAVEARPLRDGLFEITIVDRRGNEGMAGNRAWAAGELPNLLGKELADKIVADTADGRTRRYSGLDLKVGGAGLRGFYDKILPAAVNKWAKKFGGRVGETRVPRDKFSVTRPDMNSRADFDTAAEANDFAARNNGTVYPATYVDVHSLDVTMDMRDAALQGLPLFSRPEQVTDAIDGTMAGPPAAFAERARTMFRSLDPKNLRENTRPAWLGALTLRHLAELGKDIRLPQVGSYADRVQRMATDRNVMHEDAAKVSDTWEKFQRRDRAGADATANLMHDTTILGVDPSTDYVPLMTGTTSRGGDEAVTAESIGRRRKLVEADLEKARSQKAIDRLRQELGRLNELLAEEQARRDGYPELVRRYAALPEAGRKLYVEARDAYTRQSDRLLAALEARIQALEIDGRQKAAMISQVRQEFESARVRGPYFPLQRFGDFWISAEDKNGTPLFTMYERVQDWREAQRDLKARGYTVKAAGRKLDEARSLGGASGGFMSELMNMLDVAGVDQDTRDEAYQLYLRTLPELSMRKHQIHRKGTAGYSKDALRAFSSNLFHGSFQIARLRHAHELEADLLGMKSAVNEIASTDPERAAKAAALYTEVGKRHEWVMNPRDSKVASTLTSIGFAWYLGSTPAAALVNLTQTAIVTFPVLAARFGAAKAFNALSDGMGRSLRNIGSDPTRGLNEEERAAFKAWHESGALDRSQAHNLAGLSETDTQSYSGLQRRTMEVVSWLFHRAEVVNREASALAAFRLARQAGQGFHEATRYAEEVVLESHFDYSNANRARWMQSNAAKVLLLFRQYSLNITWFLWRNLYLSTTGEAPEVRREARAKLAGVLGMTGVFSGLLGMPLMSVMFGVANAAAAAFGGGDDEDEPFDAEVAFRNLLADLLGADVARILARGPVDYFTGANISGRVSLNDLWLREPNRELEGKAQANYLLEQAAGPLFGGMLVNTLRGLQQVEEGHTWRGVETMMPKAVKDGMKSVRYATQGVNTLRGDPVIEDLSVGESLLQLAGFSPARLNEQYDGINAAKNYERRLLDRRESLLNAYAMAWRASDPDTLATVREKIKAWNEAQPALAITTSTIRRSLAARMRYSSKAEAGVVLDRRVADAARAQARFSD